MMSRAVAILGLPNCVVRQQDIGGVTDRFDAVVSRVAIPPELLVIHVKRILNPQGTALVGLSRTGSIGILPADDHEMSLSLVSIPREVLDSGASLLRIEPT